MRRLHSSPRLGWHFHSSRRLSSLVTFGEPLYTFKPSPLPPPALPLASGASVALQAIGGAELNVAVAHARLSAHPGAAAFVSVLPHGALGDHVLATATAAGVSTDGVIRMDGEMGMLHVVDTGTGPRPLYQREHSAFCASMDKNTHPWPSLLEGASWLHLTGITPALCPGARDAWHAAIDAAQSSAPRPVHVSLDLNHRPALGSLEALWRVVEPKLAALSLLMLSEDSLYKLAKHESVWEAATVEAATEEATTKAAEPIGAGAGDARKQNMSAEHPVVEHPVQRAALRLLRGKWQVPLLGCCFKRPLASAESFVESAMSDDGATQREKDVLFGGGVRRWSVIAAEGAHVSTEAIAIEHSPVQALGGGDAWVAGFLHSAIERGLSTRLIPPSSPHTAISHLPPLEQLLQDGCRRGDLLAALQMETHGDLSHVDGPTLFSAEAAYQGVPARHSTSLRGAPTARDAPRPLHPTRDADSDILERLESARIVPVVSLDDPEHAVPVAKALLAGGLDVLELVLRSDAAELSLERIADELDGLMLVGAGTVLSVAQAERAVRRGARFLVSPGTNPRVVRWATGEGVGSGGGVPIVPGVASATEVEAAMGLGLTHVKFFPAEANGGAKALKALAGPYGHTGLRWMPTGGVSVDNMQGYLSQPQVFAVGGSWLVPADALKARDYAAIEALARAAVAMSRRV